jgi:hypothetical protein
MKQAHGHRRHLTVDGVDYDVSNLFLAATQKETILPVDLNWRGRKNLSFIEKPSYLRSQTSSRCRQRKEVTLPQNDELKQSQTGQPSTNFVRMVTAQGHGLKQPPSYSKVDSPKQTYAKDTSSPEQEEIKSPRTVVGDHPQNTPMVEIEPGVHEPLRGSKETGRAVQLGLVTHLQCLCCTQDISCIRNAAYFLCPTCFVVGPVPSGVWGVGLGFLTSYDD